MRASTCATIFVVLTLVVVISFTAIAQESGQVSPPVVRNISSPDNVPPAGAVLTLAEAEAQALETDYTAPLFNARAQSFRKQAEAARAMPDPSLFMGLQAVPIDTFSLEQEPMTQAQVGLRQMFPRTGEREFRANQYLARAGLQSAQALHQARLVAREVGANWLELFYWLKAESVVRDNEELFSQMVHVATSLYSQGKSNQADILRAELELKLLSERLLQIRQMQDQARAKLTLWLDEDKAALPLPDELPELPPLPPLAALRAGLISHPLLEAQDAGVEIERDGVDLARSQFNTQWSVAITYGHRPGTAADGSDWADFISIGITTDLPFFTGGLQERKLDSSLLNLTAAQAGRDDALARLNRELNDEFARWSLLNKRLALYDQELLSLVGDHAEASLQAYQNDVANFATIVRARIVELETHLKWWRLRTDLANATVRLKYFQGDDS